MSTVAKLPGQFKIIKTSDKYTITYEKANHSYTGIIETPAKYFTYDGYIDYINDNIANLKYIDGFAQYTMVKIPMTEVIKELTLLELQKRIRRLENIVCLRLKSKDNSEAIGVIKTIYNLVIAYDDISGEYEFDDNFDSEDHSESKEDESEEDADCEEDAECEEADATEIARVEVEKMLRGEELVPSEVKKKPIMQKRVKK